MNQNERLESLIRARTLTSSTLVGAMKSCPKLFSERELAVKWLRLLQKEREILPFGWYQPPPNGISVLVGNAPSYSRLDYESLREKSNWPRSKECFSEESIIYPYFSPIHADSFLIGDQVGTYYGGNQAILKEWISEAFEVTVKITDRVKSGMLLSEVFQIGREELGRVGARNNTFSHSGGLASDIGHSIPLFSSADFYADIKALSQLGPAELAAEISKKREFVSEASNVVLDPPFAFTVEPQILTDGLPMASFHTIVAFTDDGKTIIRAFREIFEYFGMASWIKSTRSGSSGGSVTVVE